MFERERSAAEEKIARTDETSRLLRFASPQETMPVEKVIVGLGAGHGETRWLADLLNAQPDSDVTFETGPLLDWDPTQEGLGMLSARIDSIARKRTSRVVGDAASVYLAYLPELLESNRDVLAVGIAQERDAFISSTKAWLSQTHPLPVNHWLKAPWQRRNMQHEFHCPIRSRAFPKYADVTADEGIGRYWDEYARRIAELQSKYRDRFFVFDVGELQTAEGQRQLLNALGMDFSGQVHAGQPVTPSSSIDTAHGGPHYNSDPSKCVGLVPYQKGIPEACESGLRELERRGYAIRRFSTDGSVCALNSAVTEALCDGYLETLWISPAVKFHPASVDILRQHQADIACIPVFDQHGKPQSFRVGASIELRFGKSGDVVEVQSASLAFLHVRRYVYEGIAETNRLPLMQNADGLAVPFMVPKVALMGDAYRLLEPAESFCAAARAIGFRIIADCRVRIWNSQRYGYSWEDSGVAAKRYADYSMDLES